MEVEFSIGNQNIQKNALYFNQKDTLQRFKIRENRIRKFLASVFDHYHYHYFHTFSVFRGYFYFLLRSDYS